MNTVRLLYKRLLTFYPTAFREQLAESMEQTFQDVWDEKRNTKKELFGVVLWTFFETATGILREHLLLISRGGSMQAILKTVGSPALLGLLIIIPLMIMEVVNRRDLREDFPTFLFFIMWLNLFAVSLILVPIVRGKWSVKNDSAVSSSAQKSTLLTSPRSTVLISILLILTPGIFPLLDALGLLSADRLFNGPNPEVTYLPGLFLTLALLSLPIAAGMVAGGPIASKLREGGSLFAHPINLIIVAFLLSTFIMGFTTLLIDQWPCFIGVPNCD